MSRRGFVIGAWLLFGDRRSAGKLEINANSGDPEKGKLNAESHGKCPPLCGLSLLYHGSAIHILIKELGEKRRKTGKKSEKHGMKIFSQLDIIRVSTLNRKRGSSIWRTFPLILEAFVL